MSIRRPGIVITRKSTIGLLGSPYDGWSEQYHKLVREQEGLANANCFAHAIKAMGKGNLETVKASVAYKALVRIGAIYGLEGTLKIFLPKSA